MWPVIILIGLIFIFSNFLWLLPFIHDVEKGAAQYQGEVARRVASQADFFVEQKLRAMGSLALSVLEGGGNEKKAQQLIQKFLSEHPDFVTLSLVPAGTPQDEYVVGSVETIGEKKFMTLTAPIPYTAFDMKAWVSVQEVMNRAQGERVGVEGTVYIIDTKGGIIFHANETVVSKHMLRARPMIASGEGTGTYVNERGDAVFAAAVTAAGAGWTVVAESPLYEAWANKYHAINLAIMLMLVGGLFVVILIVNFRKIMGIALRERQLREAKTGYLSLLAHQLRTPLSGTKWNLKTLLDGDWGPLNAQQKKFLMRSYETNEQMITLVRDLLDITRIEEGRYDFLFKKADMADFITRVAGEFRVAAREAGVTLTVKKPRGRTRMPLIPIDAEKMQMALSNLIDNAIRYNQPEGRVEIGYGADKKMFTVQVKDTGVGIPRKDQHKLFTKFFRGDNVVKMQVQGFGLGLYIVKNIVERHGGTMSVQSKENKGTVFTITLPVR